MLGQQPFLRRIASCVVLQNSTFQETEGREESRSREANYGRLFSSLQHSSSKHAPIFAIT